LEKYYLRGKSGEKHALSRGGRTRKDHVNWPFSGGIHRRKRFPSFSKTGGEPIVQILP